MKRHSGPRRFPGAGKLRPDTGARSGGSAAAPVRPMKGLHGAPQRPPWFSRGREIASGKRGAVRWIGGRSCEADEGPS